MTLLPVSLPTLALMCQCRDTQQDTPFLLFPQLPHISTFPERTAAASERRLPRNDPEIPGPCPAESGKPNRHWFLYLRLPGLSSPQDQGKQYRWRRRHVAMTEVTHKRREQVTCDHRTVSTRRGSCCRTVQKTQPPVQYLPKQNGVLGFCFGVAMLT